MLPSRNPLFFIYLNKYNYSNVPKIQYTTSNNDSIISSSNPQLLSAKKKSSVHEITPKREIFQMNKNEANNAKLQLTPRNNIPQKDHANQANKSDLILREKNMNVNQPTPKNEAKIAPKKVLSCEQELENKAVVSKLDKPEKQSVPVETQKNEGKPPPSTQNKQIVPYTSPTPILPPPAPVQALPLPESTTFKTLKIRGKDYIMINKLGEGGSGQVYRCLDQETLQDRAVKVVNLAVDAHTAASYINEVKMLKDLQGSDRVIKMYDL